MAVLEPGLIGVMGDVHANTAWTVRQIPLICERLRNEFPKVILQAGDLGVWKDDGTFTWMGQECYRKPFLEEVTEALEANDAEMRICEGNHEDHDYLAELAEKHAELHGYCDEVPVTSRITWLRRGARWTWHGRTWLAVGGAVSVDKLTRTEGVNWFPQEEITGKEEFMISAAGSADVLLSHDAPADCPLNLGVPYDLWLPMIPRAEEHRDRLQRICVAVKPSYIFHGHYHLSQIRTVHAIWGKCRFTSLDMDGKRGNWGILDTRTMEWGW